MSSATAGRSLAFAHHGNRLVLVHTRRDPEDAHWRQWVSFVLKRAAANPRAVSLLVVSAGGSPSVRQRALLRDVAPDGEGGPKTAVVIESRVGRAVAATMTRFNRRLSVFGPETFGRALDYVEVPNSERLALLQCVRGLHGDLGIPCVVML